MINRILTCCFSLSLLLCSQCKKIEVTPDVMGTPVFTISADIGTSEPLLFSAGVDDYAMLASYELGTDNVYNFIGEFRQELGQNSSQAALRIEIRDVQDNPSLVDVDTALMQPNYNYYNTQLQGQIDTTFSITFLASTENCPQNIPEGSYFWDFGNNQLATGSNPTVFFEDDQDRVVQLMLNYDQGQEVVVQKDFSPLDSILDCSVGINIVTQNNYILTAIANGTPPFTYEWDSGETSSSITLPVDSFTVYSVSVMDAIGCFTVVEGQIPINTPNGGLCTPDFTHTTTVEVDTLAAPAQFSTATIIYTDENGNEFRSDLSEQEAGSFFTIQNVDNFSNNENGQKTKKITLDFACQLFSGGFSPIDIESTGAVIAVAYPD